MAGPNEGGTLILHANPSLVFTSTIQNYCGMSAPDSCSAAVTSVAWDPGKKIVFHAIAAFPPGSNPRLKALSFGIDFDSTKFILAARGTCADFEIPDGRWPAPSSGTSQSWTTGAQTDLLTEAYWFVGYAYSEQEGDDSTSVSLIPHPLQHGVFVDDAFPSEVDTIAAYGRLGFGMAGALPCPTGGGDIVWVTMDGFDDMDGQSDESEPPGDEVGFPDASSATGDLTFVELEATSAAGYAEAYRGLRNDYGLLIQLGMIPDALICRTDPWQRSLLLQDERVNRVTLDPISGAPGDLLPGDAGFAESVWNAMHVPITPDSASRSFDPEVSGVLFNSADSLRSTPVGQTVTYMMGDVGVSLLFMESDSTGPGTCKDQLGEPIRVEDWTSTELALGTARIAQGFLRLVSLAPAGANLAFTLQDTVLSTTVEPIQAGTSNPKWFDDAMNALDVPGDPLYYNRMWYLNNRCRAQLGWDWWFTAYVARDVCDADRNFNSGLPCGGAFWIGGPGIWVSYLCGTDKPNNLLLIPPHETGHVFGAPDEYGVAWSCSDTTNCHGAFGYLRERNGNCVNCPDNPEEVSCLMRGMPYEFTICPFTRAHLGWRDTDGDGICDPIDNPRSNMSMRVGDIDSVRVGDWVDIHEGGTCVRRLAATERNTDQGQMLWDGIDDVGNGHTPGTGYFWRRLEGNLHADTLIVDTQAPTISPDLLISHGFAPPPYRHTESWVSGSGHTVRLGPGDRNLGHGRGDTDTPGRVLPGHSGFFPAHHKDVSLRSGFGILNHDGAGLGRRGRRGGHHGRLLLSELGCRRTSVYT
jgi:hypothetical protein